MKRIYSIGMNENMELGRKGDSGKIKESRSLRDEGVVQIASGCKRTLFLKENGDIIDSGQIEPYTKGKRTHVMDNEVITSIHEGAWHFAIQTVSGKVYMLGINNGGSLGLGGVRNVAEPTPITAFIENDITVKDVMCCQYNTFFLTTNGDLYGCGLSAYMGSGKSLNDEVQRPTFLRKNVERIFGGASSKHYFFSGTDGFLYGCGENSHGCMGIMNSSRNNKNKIDYIDPMNIKKLGCGLMYSALLTNDGEVLITGATQNLGCYNIRDQYRFMSIPGFKDVNITDISFGSNHCLALSSDMTVYSWGANSYKEAGIAEGRFILKPMVFPIEIESGKDFHLERITVKAGLFNSYIFVEYQNSSLLRDLESSLMEGWFPDCEICGIKAHKLIVESRTKLACTQIEEIVSEFSKDDVWLFLEWVYMGKNKNDPKAAKIFEKLGLDKETIYASIKQTLSELYRNEESMDFTISVSDVDEEGEEEVFEVYAHKTILAIRSGLLRELFSKIDPNIKEIKEYLGITLESMEHLIHFLYTDTIEITGDDYDIPNILNELSEMEDFYKLSTHPTFQRELERIKKEFF